MKNTLFVGLAIGMVAGACIAGKSRKVRKMVTDAQDQIKNKLCPVEDGGEQNGESGVGEYGN